VSRLDQVFPWEKPRAPAGIRGAENGAVAAAVRLPRPRAEYRISERSAPRHSRSAIVGALSMMHRMRFMRVTRPQSRRRSVLFSRSPARFADHCGLSRLGKRGEKRQTFSRKPAAIFALFLQTRLFISVVRTRAYAFNSNRFTMRDALADKSTSRIDICDCSFVQQSGHLSQNPVTRDPYIVDKESQRFGASSARLGSRHSGISHKSMRSI